MIVAIITDRANFLRSTEVTSALHFWVTRHGAAVSVDRNMPFGGEEKRRRGDDGVNLCA